VGGRPASRKENALRHGIRSGGLSVVPRRTGVTPLLLPARSPNLNALAERFVGSVKSECLSRIVPLGEGHLRAAVQAFVDHYHEERPHQGLGNECIAPTTSLIGTGPVRCRERLGGVLKFYYRAAAQRRGPSCRTQRDERQERPPCLARGANDPGIGA
jgi:hypothetical protein